MNKTLSCNIEIIDRSKKFMEFYNAAKDKDEAQVWAIWKEKYNFAAVPPGEQGQEMAKQLLKDAWSKYPDIISYIETWEPNKKKIEKYLEQVQQVLGCNDTINIVLIYYVGTFDDNAFVAPYKDGKIALCLPIESGEDDIVLVHELTHIVHSRTAEIAMSWLRPVSTLVYQEGLAMHLSKYLVPGNCDEKYVEHREGWLKSCQNQTSKICDGILPYLDETSSEILYKFAVKNDSTGNEREAYFIGWELIARLLAAGQTFKHIASIKEDEMSAQIRAILA